MIFENAGSKPINGSFHTTFRTFQFFSYLVVVFGSVCMVLTETTPDEVPLIFSNEGFYKNCLCHIETNNYLYGLFEKIVVDPIQYHTILLKQR